LEKISLQNASNVVSCRFIYIHPAVGKCRRKPAATQTREIVVTASARLAVHCAEITEETRFIDFVLDGTLGSRNKNGATPGMNG
jgi:hypothetical protein